MEVFLENSSTMTKKYFSSFLSVLYMSLASPSSNECLNIISPIGLKATLIQSTGLTMTVFPLNTSKTFHTITFKSIFNFCRADVPKMCMPNFHILFLGLRGLKFHLFYRDF